MLSRANRDSGHARAVEVASEIRRFVRSGIDLRRGTSTATPVKISAAWLISRFVNPEAEFIYVPAAEVSKVAADVGGTPYDIDGVKFGHVGDRCSFDAIVDTLVSEGRIELRNFGVFEVKRRKPRKARNPRTGDAVDVEAKNVVTFQPGKIMEEKVRDAKKVVEPKRKTRKPGPRPVPVGAGAPAPAGIPEPSGNGESPLKPR